MAELAVLEILVKTLALTKSFPILYASDLNSNLRGLTLLIFAETKSVPQSVNHSMNVERVHLKM